ncbi:restriction endonuclease subunit S [Candidatus Methylospira mobilis]|uniref:Restriction endonuclease subunit S n=1 Tax=Candidatus Methylospira mobilis TaxID=1808979 RepID=A0A5Q0BNW2_9GAMM|nr:restriction endonuclease subunit S [Candidatus Methylospira mobilis]QFY43941.1 restriction endonuclease subunit S [Candidatus Methylospira mobilis]
MSSKTKTTATKEEARPALVPKLRFPEFRGGDAWEPTTIGALGRFYYGKSAPKWSLAEDAPTPCVRYGELYTKFGPAITETYSRTNTDPETLRFSKGGEILIPRVGEKPEDFGKCCAYLPLKGIAIGEMISVLETKQHPLFYTYYFRHLYKQFAKVVEGQNVKNLYFTELEPLPIHRPSIPEQQKIAECLSSVDELMVAQARKVDALKTHKKGLMQQLFPREGETQPRLRFPEFQNAGEWEMQPLKEVFSIFQGFAFSSNDSVERGCRWLKIADVGIQLMNHEAPSFLPDVYKECFAKFLVREGDYVIALTRPILSGQLKVAEVDDIFDGALLNQRVGKLITSQHPAFVFFLLQTWKLISDIEKSISGNDPPNLSAQQIEGIMTYVPRLREQQRIASCLSSLDTLITLETQKLEALKTHKKGLMQQLFPSLEEVEA